MKQILTMICNFFLFSSIIKAQFYDYIIVTPDIFRQGSGVTWDVELLELQTARGFTPRIETVSVNTTAEQIKYIIANLYNSNPVKYVLLMGSGKNLNDPDYDYPGVPYGYLQHGIVNTQVDYINGTFIPFFSVESNNPWEPSGIEYVASDDPYVSDLTSHGPVFIGRVPVTSKEEANDYVDKLQVYYQSLSTYTPGYNKEILLNLNINLGHCTGDLVNSINTELQTNHIPASTSIIDLKVSDYNNCPSVPADRFCQTRQD